MQPSSIETQLFALTERVGELTQAVKSVETELGKVGKKLDVLDKRIDGLEETRDVQRGVLKVSRTLLAGIGAVVLITLTILANAAWQWLSQMAGWKLP